MYLFIWLVDHDHIDRVWNTIISGADRGHCIIVFDKFFTYQFYRTAKVKGFYIMIWTTGLVAGTMALAFGTATPLQPANIVRVDNNTTRVYVTKDMVLHLSNTDAFEIIVDKGGEPIAQGDNKHGYDIKVLKGTTLNIDARTGYNNENFKIGDHDIFVNSSN